MNNPLYILKTLDSYLEESLNLTIYGRGALAVGFSNPPPEIMATLDVDGIIPLPGLEAIVSNQNFWEAIEKTNMKLESQGMYITHLFQEDQVIIRPNWQDFVVAIDIGTQKLKIQRPSTIDLILTKCMRGADPQDMADIRFLISEEQIPKEQILDAFECARIPDIQDLKNEFLIAKEAVLKMIG